MGFNIYIIFLFIFVSGNPFYSGEIYELILFIILLVINTKSNFKKRALLILFSLVILTILQSWKFGEYYVVSNLGFLVRVSSAYLVLNYFRSNFIFIFSKVTSIVLIYSMCLYLLSLLFQSELSSLSFNTSGMDSDFPRLSFLSLYTFIPGEYKNCGPFWESGAFAGFIVFSRILLYSFNKKFSYGLEFLYLVSLITTFSTMGYAIYFLYVLFAASISIKNMWVKAVLISALSITGFFAFMRMPFMFSKVREQIVMVDDYHYEHPNSQRFMSLYRDLDDFEGHRYLGRGFSDITRYKRYIEGQIRTVGLSDLLVRLGIIWTFLLFFIYFRSMRNILYRRNMYEYWLLSLLLLLVNSSEMFFNYPLMWTIFFLDTIKTSDIVI